VREKISVLMIDGEENDLPLLISRCLGQEPNIKQHILSDRTWATTRFTRHRSKFLLHEPVKTEADWLGIIQDTIKKTQPDVVIPIREKAVRLLSKFNGELSPLAAVQLVPPLESFDRVIDKTRLATFAKDKSIPIPKSVQYTDSPNFEAELDTVLFPVLAKPAHGISGQGIREFHQRDALLKFLATLTPEASDRYIVQEFIQGYDIDCNLLCKDGEILAYSVQKGLIPGKERFSPPSGVQFVKDEHVLEVASIFAKATNWSGVAHLDMRYNNQTDSFVLIEVNPRYWASVIATLAVGINFPYLTVLASLGIEFDMPDYFEGRFMLLNQATIKKMFRKEGNLRIKWRETDLRYIAADPIAEASRLYFNFMDYHFPYRNKQVKAEAP